ncbi:MAG TPA: hypothetical protein VFA70_13530, partial [Dehalococcoidia bacterium]|nr:hypothetical protein [Dehalococcoidia bacterium]
MAARAHAIPRRLASSTAVRLPWWRWHGNRHGNGERLSALGDAEDVLVAYPQGIFLPVPGLVSFAATGT